MSNKEKLVEELKNIKKDISDRKIKVGRKTVARLKSLLTSITDIKNYELSISGSTIRNLDETYNIYDNDLFLITTNRDNEPKSKKIKYCDLSKNILSSSNELIGIGSMAYQTKIKYSLSSHNHNGLYCSLSVIDNMKDYVGNSTKIASISVYYPDDMKEIGIYAPLIRQEYTLRPEVGTLKFVAVDKTYTKITEDIINRDDFDGWVYPDGSTFEVRDTTRFSEALKIYGISENEIQLPTLDKFFKLSSKPVADFGLHNQQLGLAEHSHTINKNLELSCNIKISSYTDIYPYNKNDRNNLNNKEHIAYGEANQNATIKNIESSINLENVTLSAYTEYFESDNQVYEPRHVSIPVMIYIGGIV